MDNYSSLFFRHGAAFYCRTCCCFTNAAHIANTPRSATEQRYDQEVETIMLAAGYRNWSEIDGFHFPQAHYTESTTCNGRAISMKPEDKAPPVFKKKRGRPRKILSSPTPPPEPAFTPDPAITYAPSHSLVLSFPNEEAKNSFIKLIHTLTSITIL